MLGTNLPSWRDLMKEPPPWAHMIHLYKDPAHQVEVVSVYAAEGLRRGENIFLIGDPLVLEDIEERLGREGFDVAHLKSGGELTPVDRNDLKAKVFWEGKPDRERLKAFLDSIIEGARDRRGIRAWGNLVDALCQAGDFEASVMLEDLWNQVRGDRPLVSFCSYSVEGLVPDPAAEPLLRAFDYHTHLILESKSEAVLQLWPVTPSSIKVEP